MRPWVDRFESATFRFFLARQRTRLDIVNRRHLTAQMRMAFFRSTLARHIGPASKAYLEVKTPADHQKHNGLQRTQCGDGPVILCKQFIVGVPAADITATDTGMVSFLGQDQCFHASFRRSDSSS